MTTYNWSTFSLPNPAAFRRQRITNTAGAPSPLTGAIQTAERAGGRWRLIIEWVVSGADRDALEGLLSRLNGMQHRLALPMFGHTVRGAWSGTPVVDGASQTGYSLNLRGGGLSVTNYARAGDFFSFDNCVRMVTADADTDGSGDVTLEIWPPIRTSPADATAVDITAPEGVYMLREMAEVPVDDVLASGELLSRIECVFEDDVLA